MSDSASVVSMSVLPLRDVVVFPQMVVPLFVGRDKSIVALKAATETSKEIMLVAQKNPADENPGRKGLHSIGTVATILQMLKLPDGTVKVLVEGSNRAELVHFDQDDYTAATVRQFAPDVARGDLSELLDVMSGKFEEYVKLSKKIPQELADSLKTIDEPSRLVDTISAHLELKLESKQDLLETRQLSARIEKLIQYLSGEVDLIQVDRRVRGRVKKQMEKSQREYYLNEQMKAIQKEIGDLNEAGNEFDDIEERIRAAGMPEEALKKATAELGKLRMMSPMSAEANVVRSYIDWLTQVPWKKRTRVKHDIARATEVLNDDHYGLDEVKERILEYLAVQSRVRQLKGPVLCLVGPPGVGKTSLGQSIAEATNRKFVRMALGGVRDEAEIRGHRRTYIGSLPGKLIQKMAKAGSRNPLFLLDEVDKMGMDQRGDPASALLEVLDPEQNHTFNDHYLEVDFDLSEVLFICTSNTLNIPSALLDRMEIIRIPGYTEDEKVKIAQRYLLPKQMKNNGLATDELTVEEEAIREVIRYYTREAGVRGLERELAKLCRKVVMKQIQAEAGDKKSTKSAPGKAAKQKSAGKKRKPITVAGGKLGDYLGVQKFNYGRAASENRIGQVTGLAWTSVGGELLSIECSAVKGKGKVIKTGSLGDVMQESIQAALTVVRGRSQLLGIADDFHEKFDIHVHVPEGATPKDGPSAGIAMCTALVSSLKSIPVNANVAMTGEITLRGEVLAIGGLKEKLLAAHRGGITKVVIPHDNVKDLKEIPDNIKDELEIIPARWIDELLAIALESTPFTKASAESASEDGVAKVDAEKPDKKKDDEGDTDHRAHH
ncbi:MAG: endopeptidase La [unclassified Hahellaceae]|nr:endopeptidase La [Hahellaceae bacterium]